VTDIKVLKWLQPVVESWRSSHDQGRPPHAIMLAGPAGTGKRCAAAWLARRRLGLDAPAVPAYPAEPPEHADARWLAPAEDKHTIGIDQVRELVRELSLTSYEGGGKVAVIEPADAMTTSAANSLLKTLEEPPGDTLLVLVVDRPGHLPATIFSRCQRINVRAPAEAEGIAWLQGLQPGADWAPVLRESGLAPLAALRAMERSDEMAAMAKQFAAVAQGREGPLKVAATWARLEPEFVLSWLCRQVQMCISRTANGTAAGVPAVIPDSVLERIDRKNLFCYLDIINRLRGQPAGSFNVQLTLESLLIDWGQRLESVAGNE
jgi:DNA polymerase-3 subunit delta'